MHRLQLLINSHAGQAVSLWVLELRSLVHQFMPLNLRQSFECKIECVHESPLAAHVLCIAMHVHCNCWYNTIIVNL